jgi:tRNA G18 (ribose-2'-O)-methylase SpoU
MSKKKIRSLGDLSLTSPAHQEALQSKDEHYRLWNRNVVDRFKALPEQDIKDELAKTAHPFAVCFEHWIGDFNMASGVRNANAFNAKEVFYIGDKKWDKRAAVGVHNYTEVQWLESVEDFMKLQERYTIVGIDNLPGKSISIKGYQWPENTLMVFGEEGTGLTTAMQSFCKDIVEIPMFGSVRSLNCGVASGIVMYDFVEKFSK